MPEKKFQPEKTAPGAELEALQERVAQLESQLKMEQPSVSSEKKEEVIRHDIKEYLQEFQQTPATAAPLATRD